MTNNSVPNLPTPSDIHPLNRHWTLSVHGDGYTKLNFINNISPIYTMTSVEDFWGVWYNLKTPAQLDPPHGRSFSLFENGIIPAWEDAAHANGSKVSFRLYPRNVRTETLVQTWRNLQLLCIGECFGANSADVTGVYLSVKRNFWKFQVWMRTDGWGGSGREMADALRRHLPISKQGHAFEYESFSLGQ